MARFLIPAAAVVSLFYLMPVQAATLTTLASFNGTNGRNPQASLLIDGSGTLYGTTMNGGASGRGTVFSLTSSGTLTTLVSFDYANGSNPVGTLLADASGTLYGTTAYGGAAGSGTVFRLTSNGTLTTMVNFGVDSGGTPFGGLIADGSGKLYGTTVYGASPGLASGTVFSLSGSGIFTTLAQFNGANGSNPYGSLIADTSGTLFGTTATGGAFNSGTIFSLTSSGILSTLTTFNGTNGASPFGSLIADASGTLYGTTLGGGASGLGTVFSLTKDGTLKTLVSFSGSNGSRPSGDLLLNAAGTLYGTTREGGGGFGHGTVFSLTSSGTLTTLVSFGETPADDAYPSGGLIADASGTLYGTTSGLVVGTVFSLSQTGFAVSVPSVPEPASWALLITGFGLTGFAARRRRALSGSGNINSVQGTIAVRRTNDRSRQ